MEGEYEEEETALALTASCASLDHRLMMAPAMGKRW